MINLYFLEKIFEEKKTLRCKLNAKVQEIVKQKENIKVYIFNSSTSHS